MTERKYMLDRYVNGCLMAQGATVTASSLEDAIAQASELFDKPYITVGEVDWDGKRPGERTTFKERLMTSNQPCEGAETDERDSVKGPCGNLQRVI